MNGAIDRIFIANRGEIARRIASTARRMGLATVCVTDRKRPPGYLSDYVTSFVKVDQESLQLYLDADAMVALAKKANAKALHPGFGFLSESSVFAQKVIDAGLIWIGPAPETIAVMGDKNLALQAASQAQVPCLKSQKLARVDREATLALGNKLNYPVLIKAAFGGGGRGMRIACDTQSLVSEAEQAYSEAKKAFGDGTLLIESYIKDARHVEVQVLADSRGQVAILGDRDCSIQRRYQKIIEEAPAPCLDTKIREQLHTCSRRLAKQVDYVSAGTVEFLVNSSQEIFFLEMNTRIQVEHPVSEAVFGVDLIEWQIRIARGEALAADLFDRKARGHCIEARIYAEDPSRQFFPTSGYVSHFDPAHRHGVRWDYGIETGDEIASEYDPMLAKLSAHAATRNDAAELLAQALEDSCLLGPTSNIPLLISICRDSEFRLFNVNTGYLKSHLARLLGTTDGNREKLEKLATGYLDRLAKEGSLLPRPNSQFSSVSQHSLAMFLGKGQAQAQLASDTDTVLDERLSKKGERDLLTGKALADKDGQAFFYSVLRTAGTSLYALQINGHSFYRTDSRGENRMGLDASHSSNDIIAPVPGRVAKILCSVGEEVAATDTLIIIDSMKMEFRVKTNKNATIKKVLVRAGDQLVCGQKLVELN